MPKFQKWVFSFFLEAAENNDEQQNRQQHTFTGEMFSQFLLFPNQSTRTGLANIKVEKTITTTE
jgi:hypothetical protein